MNYSSFHTAIWLIPLLPFCAGVVNALLPKSAKLPAFALAVGSLGASMVMSVALLFTALTAPAGTPADTVSFTWLTFGSTHLTLGFLLNPLTALMVAMVSFVSLLIFIYSHGYMHHDENYARFFSFLAMFAGGMLGLCVANSLVLLFVSWEIVGVCSYLLIGFWYTKPSAAAAAKKAFIVTKLGDIGFFVGLLWIYAKTGTQLIYDNGSGILDAGNLAHLASITDVFFGMNLAGVLALLLFCGAVGKSGQFPLHVWLPDAMEGPTPVSALIHAATMVAAGVFLVGRMYPLFEAEPKSLDVVMWIGAATSLMAATIAVAQRDIKRILAYSTVSQLGLMMLGLGAAGFVAGIFHLITHAFFKALLFLGSGSVIHAMSDEQDIFAMGGLRGKMKTTFATYVIGALALAGVFPLAGFWSKDGILGGAWEHGHVVPAVIGMLVSFLTSFYMTRQVALVFFGSLRRSAGAKSAHAGDTHHSGEPHESPAVMTLPLVILAVFALGLGFVGTPAKNMFAAFLEGHSVEEHVNIALIVVAGLIPLAGIGLGWSIYGRTPLTAGQEDPLAKLPGYTFFANRWYIDELYKAVVVAAVVVLARISATVDDVLDRVTRIIAGAVAALSHINYLVDERVVRPFVRLLATIVRGGGGILSRMQNGKLHDYLSAITVGAVVIVATYFLMQAMGGGR